MNRPSGKIQITLSLLAAFAASQSTLASPTDISISGPGFNFSVRGSGGWVCSAQDSFKKLPYLGRGESRSEAEAYAKALASESGTQGAFFVQTLSCEQTQSGRGSISVHLNDSGATLIAEGPSHVTCIAKDSFDAVPFIAKAGTQTEASALASRACTESNSRQGFFCSAQCEQERNSPEEGGFGIGGFHLPWRF